MRYHGIFGSFVVLGLASATTYTPSVFAPGTEVDGATLNAAGQAFYTGTPGPATYCPAAGTGCPVVQGTLVYPGFTAMAVSVPGGQRIYVAPDGEVRYTQAHSAYMPQGTFVGGWFDKTIVSDCAAPFHVLDFLSPDGSNAGGAMLCPDVPDFMAGTGASYRLYMRTPHFHKTGCAPVMGLVLHPNPASIGAWQYT